jgi:hypothetical protein
LPDPVIGRWSNGEPIDIDGVPLTRAFGHCIPSARIVVPYEAKNGGSFNAHYDVTSAHDAPIVCGELASVEEVMPPRPPQIQGFSDDRRLPMMDRWGYSAAREADQRKREWAEVAHA